MTKPGEPAGSRGLMLRLTSPIWFEGHAGVVVHAQLECAYPSVPSVCGIPTPPANRSPSSTVTTNIVLDLLIPTRAWEPRWAPGSSGSLSLLEVATLGAFDAQMPPPWPQWTAMPT